MNMHFHTRLIALSLVLFLVCRMVAAGPYSDGDNYLGTGTAIDEPIPGWTGPLGDGPARTLDDNGTADPSDDEWVNEENYLNPLFKAWANQVVDYSPAGSIDPAWVITDLALGPATGDYTHVVSLGDMTQLQINAYLSDPENAPGPGSITLGFPSIITNGVGPDFAVFENGIWLGTGLLFAELAYVEVSSDGVHFARFPSESLTPNAVPSYAPLDPTNVYNLAGKHISGNYPFESWGTPFDLENLVDDPLVLDGSVDLTKIRFVRMVDIPGSGDFPDSHGNPIYDPWVTYGSGGFDLDAVGVLNVYSSNAPIIAWQAAHYDLPEEEEIAALEYESQSDGTTNLMEIALDLDPRVNNSGNLPGTELEVVDDQQYLVLRYTRNLEWQTAGLAYEVQVGTIPGTWQTSGLDLIDEIDPDVVPDPESDVQYWRARVPIVAGEQRYLQLKITWAPEEEEAL